MKRCLFAAGLVFSGCVEAPGESVVAARPAEGERALTQLPGPSPLDPAANRTYCGEDGPEDPLDASFVAEGPILQVAIPAAPSGGEDNSVRIFVRTFTNLGVRRFERELDFVDDASPRSFEVSIEDLAPTGTVHHVNVVVFELSSGRSTGMRTLLVEQGRFSTRQAQAEVADGSEGEQVVVLDLTEAPLEAVGDDE